ncbi:MULTISPECIES: ribosome biogenesis GTPase Der [unclassified Methylophaga]|uniref:ribosome biogenesis GTPase Der n=2 Tax=Methylophaga TaxID=40222 RepID=UPI000C8E0A25|nr:MULTISPECIES: ribosome biogenesis GTPase Der [unclassified Methylophaga]MAY18090.1 ribosome biogenesis GTPase Der [Methylophaga sp.]MBN45514.1 ribosome biogenesis GTPase Der [Methylophaga sp.]HCD03980.1 ribosome biogenesis GTPase Der [Methylophaga sp.]
MKPVIALVGRPNVGKSTLFNRLTKTRNALVADYAGLTRDRIYGNARHDEAEFILIDTGGLTVKGDDMSELMRKQAELAIVEADLILFVVDGKAGVVPGDELIAKQLRNVGKPVLLVINKTESEQRELAAADFYRLGLGEPEVISATQGRGISNLMNTLMRDLPAIRIVQSEEDEKEEDTSGDIRLAVVGRPNVGKSTLVNRLLGEDRVVAFDEPGTTRDSIYIPFEKDGTNYILIDTAGVRRRSKVSEALEKFSIVKTLQAIEAANVVMLVLDAHQGVVDQDLHLAGLIIESGRAVVIAVNKWDGLEKQEREWVATNIERRLPFLNFAKTHFISALHGSGVGLLLKSVKKAYGSALAKIPTPQLTRVLEEAVADHQPPLVNGRRIKYRYAHLGGKNPPRIIIHGNQTEATPNSYRRYLENYFRTALKLQGTPVMIEFKTSENPFQERKKKQPETPQEKRKRVIASRAKKRES